MFNYWRRDYHLSQNRSRNVTSRLKVMEIDLTKQIDGQGVGGRGDGGNNNNRDCGPKRKSGAGPSGLERKSFMGGDRADGGDDMGSGHDNDQRNFHNSNNGFDGPINKKQKILSTDQRIMEKIRSLQGSSADLPPKRFEVKKFLANTRLYVGNLATECTESELVEMFAAFGEIEELFVNREKNFAFLKMDFRTSAEKARSELDQKNINGRQIKVRFAPANVRVKVKNLSPMVSNELLEISFSVFGDIERALVFVDENGKSLCEGIVDFTRKTHAMAAHNYCQNKAYFLTSELRPVVTEIGEMYEADEGLLEMNLPKREFNKDSQLTYYRAREHGPRVAEEGSFEHGIADKWKKLFQEYKYKELAMKQEMEKDIEKLQTQMDLHRQVYESSGSISSVPRDQIQEGDLDNIVIADREENIIYEEPRCVLDTYQWLSGNDDTGKKKRAAFFKCFALLFPEDEFKQINTMLHHENRKRRNRNKNQSAQNETFISNEEVTTTVSIPLEASVFLPVVKPWWSKINLNEVVALDCEFVAKPINPNKCKSVVYRKRGRKYVTFKSLNTLEKVRYKQYVGSVGIVDNDCKRLALFYVQHNENTFLVNDFTTKINGFLPQQFMQGIEFKEVKKKVADLLKNKLVIVCGGSQDFISLELCMGDFDVFDLQWFFKQEINNELRPQKLKTLVHNLLKETEFQVGTHSAEEDAIMAMRLFKEAYIKNVNAIRRDDFVIL